MAIEKDTRVSLDQQGLTLLAGALYLNISRMLIEQNRTSRIRDELFRESVVQGRDTLDSLFDLEVVHDAKGSRLQSEDVSRLRWSKGYLKYQVEQAEVRPGFWRRTQHLRLCDFRWRWHHLKSAPSLTALLRRDRPTWSPLPHPKDLISRLGLDEPMTELFGIYEMETARLALPKQELEIEPGSDEDCLFELDTWGICHPRGIGRPSGEQKADPQRELIEELAEQAVFLSRGQIGDERELADLLSRGIIGNISGACREVMKGRNDWHSSGSRPVRSGKIRGHDEKNVLGKVQDRAYELNKEIKRVN